MEKITETPDPGKFKMLINSILYKDKSLIEELTKDFNLEEEIKKYDIELKHIDKKIHKLRKKEEKLRDEYEKKIFEPVGICVLLYQQGKISEKKINKEMPILQKRSKDIKQELFQILIKLKKLENWRNQIIKREEKLSEQVSFEGIN